jgi:SAM-dependent methyltransferase
MAKLRDEVNWRQYDAPDLTWGKEGDKDSPYRQFLARHIMPFIGDIEGQSVLDVGCGTGWLLHLLGQNGATRLVGVEPSHYAALAAQYYPEAEINRSTFEDFSSNEKFDLITLVMSTEVIDDLGVAFTKCTSLLKDAGRIVLCKGNYDYFVADKYDYVITREEYTPGQETVVKTERPSGYGTTIDIYRSVPRVLELAEQAGLIAVGEPVPFSPDTEVIQAVPRYAAFAERPMMELIEFRKAV